MNTLFKLIALAAIAYGLFWVSQNVDFNSIISNSTEKIQNEKTITRVVGGRQRAIEDTRSVAE